MLYAIICYILTIISIIVAKKLKFNATKPFFNLKLTKSGVSFCSTNRHKIKTGTVKILMIENVAYLKQNNKTIILKNVQDVELKKNYVFFTALGNCKIIFSAPFYRYFNIKIEAENFDLENLKREALNEMINNLFNLKNCIKLKEYLKIVTQILNIKITNSKIFVERNKYNLEFKITYKLNNITRTINVEKTI